MKLKKTDQVSRFNSLISNISDKDRIAVIHHTDPDGVCSGVLISKCIQRVRGSPIQVRLNQKSNEIGVTKKSIQILKEKKINIVFITDMAADEHPNEIRQIEKFAKIVLIDHHPINNNINSSKTIMLKASQISSLPQSQYCTAKMVYDLGSQHTDLQDLDWIAAIGVISDRTELTWITFLRQVFRKHKLRVPHNFKQSIFGQISNLLSQTEAYSSEKVRECFKVLYKAQGPKEVVNSDIQKYARAIQKEVSDQIKTHKKWCEDDYIHDALIGEVHSKFPIKSHLTGELSAKYPKKTIVCFQKIPDNKISISAWRKDGKVKMNTLLKKATRRLLNASAGGHDTMAGATIRSKDLEKFKRQLFIALEAV